MWETYSAFANTCGGVILLGIEEHMSEMNIEKRFTFTDVKKPEIRLKEFWDTINSNKVSANILLDDNVGYCDVNGHTVLWIEVPQADYKYKPVYINENPMKGSFKRNTKEIIIVRKRSKGDAKRFFGFWHRWWTFRRVYNG